MDIMVADLPHIQYNHKKKISKQQEDDLMLIAKNEQDKIKQKGLSSVIGKKLIFK